MYKKPPEYTEQEKMLREERRQKLVCEAKERREENKKRVEKLFARCF